MSKNFLLIFILIAVGIGSYYFINPAQDKAIPKDELITVDNVIKLNESEAEKSSRYLPFTPTALSDSSSTRRVLYFYASWCPTCIPANADFEKNSSALPRDLTVIRVNYNDPDTDAEEKSLAAKYGITYQHTFVQIDESGKVVTQWNGGATKELLTKIK